MMKYNLEPVHDSAKSFYGKAVVTEYNDRYSILKSYDTDVAAIKDGEFIRLWNGYSVTTMRHINEYIAQNGIEGGGKAWWDSLPVAGNQVVNIIMAVA